MAASASQRSGLPKQQAQRPRISKPDTRAAAAAAAAAAAERPEEQVARQLEAALLDRMKAHLGVTSEELAKIEEELGVTALSAAAASRGRADWLVEMEEELSVTALSAAASRATCSANCESDTPETALDPPETAALSAERNTLLRVEEHARHDSPIKAQRQQRRRRRQRPADPHSDPLQRAVGLLQQQQQQRSGGTAAALQHGAAGPRQQQRQRSSTALGTCDGGGSGWAALPRRQELRAAATAPARALPRGRTALAGGAPVQLADAAEAGMESIVALRRALGASVGQVDALAGAVRGDVLGVVSLCSVAQPRARAFMKRWACERLFDIRWACERLFDVARQLAWGLQGAAWQRWRLACQRQRRAKKILAYLRYQGASKMLFCWDNMLVAREARAWGAWCGGVQAVLSRELLTSQEEKALVLQCAWRACAARKRVARARFTARYSHLNAAATIVTKVARGKVTRLRLQAVLRERVRAHAAALLGRVGRGMLGRHQARDLRRARARRRVARGLQRLHRGNKGRARAAVLRQSRCRAAAAVSIQAAFRGWRGRRRLRQRRREAQRKRAAVLCQAGARMLLARRRCRRLREEHTHELLRKAAAALTIQRVYRGHASRLVTGVKLRVKRANQRKRHAAARAIQVGIARAGIRGMAGRKAAKQALVARHRQRVMDARAWKEQWSDDAQAWFYHNDATGESLWAPPRTGYTKKDGRLVIVTGQVIDDPFGADGDQEQIQCAECSKRRASRNCDQCQEPFCTACFRTTHEHGKRAKHTWKQLGSVECAECEACTAQRWCVACDDPFCMHTCAAQRWCVACDDPFCMECWGRAHARGRRAAHPFCAIAPDGTVCARAIVAAPSGDGPAPPSPLQLAQLQQQQAAAAGGSAAAAAAAPSSLAVVAQQQYGWSQHADDGGVPYWYNAATGVSTYEDPAGAEAALSQPLQPLWTVFQDNDGNPYWYNSSTGECTYVNPLAWSEYQDSGGIAYYYNAATGESTYDKPY
ncbi:hypothetical protein JKP88DRAFT_308384 [Tribonema minus]|uniref:WW domain-containing protein n=1 Tax=Tribonema minus TaxID=303371 RepID=A0A836CI88_9STRA|nr:hypothetical protein JKP88DRAFT_308384 [Tribonema minus]